jgi:hypothetical protein
VEVLVWLVGTVAMTAFSLRVIVLVDSTT